MGYLSVATITAAALFGGLSLRSNSEVSNEAKYEVTLPYEIEQVSIHDIELPETSKETETVEEIAETVEIQKTDEELLNEAIANIEESLRLTHEVLWAFQRRVDLAPTSPIANMDSVLREQLQRKDRERRDSLHSIIVSSNARLQEILENNESILQKVQAINELEIEIINVRQPNGPYANKNNFPELWLAQLPGGDPRNLQWDSTINIGIESLLIIQESGVNHIDSFVNNMQNNITDFELGRLNFTCYGPLSSTEISSIVWIEQVETIRSLNGWSEEGFCSHTINGFGRTFSHYTNSRFTMNGYSCLSIILDENEKPYRNEEGFWVHQVPAEMCPNNQPRLPLLNEIINGGFFEITESNIPNVDSSETFIVKNNETERRFNQRAPDGTNRSGRPIGDIDFNFFDMN